MRVYKARDLSGIHVCVLSSWLAIRKTHVIVEEDTTRFYTLGWAGSLSKYEGGVSQVCENAQRIEKKRWSDLFRNEQVKSGKAKPNGP